MHHPENENAPHPIQATSTFATDIANGLSKQQKSIASKYLYDDAGSVYFQKITGHPDYYLSRCETEILENEKHHLSKQIRDNTLDIIELGVGDGQKTTLILDGMLQAGKTVHFYPIDISKKALDQLAHQLPKHRKLHVHRFIGDYSDGLIQTTQQSRHRKLLLFLGSNIGNFDPRSGLKLLQNCRAKLSKGDYAFIGFDLKKDADILLHAYNDSAGITKAFNLNLLTRINRELDGNFNIDSFQHYATYNAQLGAMESFLISTKSQTVTLKTIGKAFKLDAFEPIHTEYSFKFSRQDIASLAEQSQFKTRHIYTDRKKYFADALWQAIPTI